MVVVFFLFVFLVNYCKILHRGFIEIIMQTGKSFFFFTTMDKKYSHVTLTLKSYNLHNLGFQDWSWTVKHFQFDSSMVGKVNNVQFLCCCEACLNVIISCHVYFAILKAEVGKDGSE